MLFLYLYRYNATKHTNYVIMFSFQRVSRLWAVVKHVTVNGLMIEQTTSNSIDAYLELSKEQFKQNLAAGNDMEVLWIEK